MENNIKQYLGPKEALIWSGAPKRGFVLRRIDLFLIPFAIFWCGFAAFWTISVLTISHIKGEMVFFSLFGVLFFLIGIFFLFGRFILDAVQRKNTVYVLTDKRIIIVTDIFRKTVRTYPIANITGVEFFERRDGYGSIVLGSRNVISWWYEMNWWPGTYMNPRLDLVPGVRNVYNKIVSLQHDTHNE